MLADLGIFSCCQPEGIDYRASYHAESPPGSGFHYLMLPGRSRKRCQSRKHWASRSTSQRCSPALRSLGVQANVIIIIYYRCILNQCIQSVILVFACWQWFRQGQRFKHEMRKHNCTATHGCKEARNDPQSWLPSCGCPATFSPVHPASVV